MEKADMDESKRSGEKERKLRRRKRKGRILGIFAGLFTTASVAAAGYLAVDYWILNDLALEPSLPAMVATVEFNTIEEPATRPETQPEAIETETEEESLDESKEETTKEEITQEDISEEETLSEANRADRELRLKAIEKFDNLGVVVGVNNYLNMRTEPSTNAEICGKIFAHCGVNILNDAGNGWYQIESGGVTGYVAQQYIATGDRAVEIAVENCRYQAEIKPETVDVLEEPDASSDVITTIRRGDHFDVLSYDGDWVELEAVEDLGGYVSISDVSVAYRLEEAIVFDYDETISETRINIINQAFEYYGGPYVFGGRSLTEGIDCSAFTYQIYKMYGIDLVESYSITQSTLGKKVEEEDIRPGDLLFYVGRFPGQIGHVAIYIGNEKIIHAASESKGICVSDWKYVPIVTIRDVIGER